MLLRIVKMHFREDYRQTFLEVFDASHTQIRNFPGCLHLELLQGADDPNQFFTYSYWENEAAIEAYRNSEVFAQTWAATKVGFDARPEAWTLDRKYYLP